MNISINGMNVIPSLSVWDILIPFEDVKPTGLIVDIAVLSCRKKKLSYRNLLCLLVFFFFLNYGSQLCLRSLPYLSQPTVTYCKTGATKSYQCILCSSLAAYLACFVFVVY